MFRLFVFFVVFGLKMISQSPGRYLRTSLDPVASISQSMSPIRATGTHFVFKITDFGRFWSQVVPCFGRNGEMANAHP